MTVSGEPADGRTAGSAADPDGPIERASANDLLQLCFDFGPATAQMGAVLRLHHAPAGGAAAIRDVLAERVRSIPRLRQRLHRVPVGCGRPIWVDDPNFDIVDHVAVLPCPAPGDDTALLELLGRSMQQHLPPDRPLWSMSYVTGLQDGSAALVMLVHHVLVDGIGGMAILQRLCDQPSRGQESPAFPQPVPRRSTLAKDALGARLGALTRLPGGARRWRRAIADLRLNPADRAAPCSLNRPLGPRRQVSTVLTELTAITTAAHARDATVNDVLLTAVTGALRDELHARGEMIQTLVVSVAVSTRPKASAAAGDAPVGIRAGNQVGAALLALPTEGVAAERLDRTARLTRTVFGRARGASSAIMEPAFRTLAALHLARWFTRHQRRVHTFATNVRGPAQRLSIVGVPIIGIIPITAANGNATVVFAALSYAGELCVSIITDPDHVPDHDRIARLLTEEFALLTGQPASDG